MYKDKNEKFNTINFREAWDKARELDPSLPEMSHRQNQDDESAIISLARRIEELEYYWSLK